MGRKEAPAWQKLRVSVDLCVFVHCWSVIVYTRLLCFRTSDFAMSFFFSPSFPRCPGEDFCTPICMWRSRAARTAAKAAGGLCCRVVIVPCMGLTVTAGAQGLYLMSLYRPLPEARRPMIHMCMHMCMRVCMHMLHMCMHLCMCTARVHRSQPLAAAASRSVPPYILRPLTAAGVRPYDRSLPRGAAA